MVPEDVKAAAARVLSEEWATDAFEQEEGRLIWVDGDNWHKLLSDAAALARYVEKLEEKT